jgi:ribonuclease HIII
VSQDTLVIVIPPAERAALRQRLSSGRFEYRSVPHSIFSVKGEGVVATLYKSGKLVVQGADPALFVARFTGKEVASDGGGGGSGPSPETTDRVTIGSDECGKGDYFGPLVVAAVRLEPAAIPELRAAGVTDSKRIADPRALQLGAWLRGAFPHAIRFLDPTDYNPTWEEQGLHTLLSSLHAEAIRELAVPGDRVVIDQFSKKDQIGPALKGLDLAIEQRPRAESEPAVAAASVIARSEFLIRLRELGEGFDTQLPKGAGPPVDAAGAEFVRSFGFESLPEVAKVHFKNTEKVRRRLDPS